MEILYSFLRTILDFVVAIATLVLSLFVYILEFLIRLIQSLAKSI